MSDKNNGRPRIETEGEGCCPDCGERSSRIMAERERKKARKVIGEAEKFLSEEIRADFAKLREYAAKNPMPECEEEPLL